MIETLRRGPSKYFIHKCSKCESILKYTRDDLHQYLGDDVIWCPECNQASNVLKEIEYRDLQKLFELGELVATFTSKSEAISKDWKCTDNIFEGESYE